MDPKSIASANFAMPAKNLYILVFSGSGPALSEQGRGEYATGVPKNYIIIQYFSGVVKTEKIGDALSGRKQGGRVSGSSSRVRCFDVFEKDFSLFLKNVLTFWKKSV